MKSRQLAVLLICMNAWAMAHALPVPTKEQQEWADCEIGAIIHFDINVYEPEYQWRGQWDYNPDPKIFNPTKLDTDQWVASVKAMGGEYVLTLKKTALINQVVLMEDIAQGERVREFTLEGQVNGQWTSLYQGTCIGHKHIIQLEDIQVSAVRLRVQKAIASPVIRDLSVYHIL